MEKKNNDKNKFQIIRKDARNCFVEVKRDCFAIGKVHLELATYDKTRPVGQRQTNHIHIYIDVPEFLGLTQEALSGTLHMRMQQSKKQQNKKPLYECLGGTSAERLQYYGRPRSDGKSLSRVVRIIAGGEGKADYLIVADSGPGECDPQGLIVPRFGAHPEQHVAVGMSWRDLNELLLMTRVHFEAWLAAQYLSGGDDKVEGKVRVSENGKDDADDMKMFP